MSDISKNIISLRNQLPGNVLLVAVSKTKPASDILEAYNTGQKAFGENRVQEIVTKKDQLPADIEWHFIGHLQTNKVKYLIPFVNMIQSVDTFKLLKTVNDEALKKGRIINCLLQIYIASEETKFGFSAEEVNEMLSSQEFKSLHNVRICGLMGMASFTDDEEQVRREFRSLNQLFRDLKARYFQNDIIFREISMGMSGDYRIAVEEGSTIIRVGSIIFGERK